MRRTQESVNVLLISLAELIPVPKIDVYKETVNLIRELSGEVEKLKEEQLTLEKQLDKTKKK